MSWRNVSPTRTGEPSGVLIAPLCAGKLRESHIPNQAVCSGRERIGGVPPAVLQSLS
jgi:hypothetical protein